MEHLPWYIPVSFLALLLLAIALFARAVPGSKIFVVILLSLAMVQSVLGLAGFYSQADTLTARFPLLVAPAMVLLFSRFFTRSGRAFIDALDIRYLTLLHTVRIGVEIVLLWLFIHKGIPQAMTFEGQNFDILSGLTAPLVYYFGFVKKRLPRLVLIGWNIVCVLLLVNVVSAAFRSLPARYLHWGFEQPNIAVGYFPFLLLPAILVPLVFFSHAAAIRQLVRR